MANAETPTLETREVEALLRQFNPKTPTGARNRALVLLMLRCGLRCSEALAVKMGWIRKTGANGTAWYALHLPKSATKGKRGRDPIPVPPEVMEALRTWQAHRERLGLDGTFFCTIQRGRRQGIAGEADLVPGKPLSARYVRELLAREGVRAGIDRERARPHVLRHTALTALYDRTKDLRLTQQVAGHASSRMTERYTHVHPEATARAMGAVAGDEREDLTETVRALREQLARLEARLGNG